MFVLVERRGILMTRLDVSLAVVMYDVMSTQI